MGENKRINIKLVLHDKQPDDPKVGDCWYTDIFNNNQQLLSNNYKKSWQSKRKPIMIELPSTWHKKATFPLDYHFPFCVDERATTNQDTEGWVVTGELPNITVSPSINAIDIWHGWIRDGYIINA